VKGIEYIPGNNHFVFKPKMVYTFHTAIYSYPKITLTTGMYHSLYSTIVYFTASNRYR